MNNPHTVHEYGGPTVRALPGPTAHPAAEAWTTPSPAARDLETVGLAAETVDGIVAPSAATG
jgi:hypothetical protein